MNKISFISLLIAFYFSSHLSAQKVKEIEPAILECQYRLTVKHNPVKKGEETEDLMILRIGKGTSQFFSHYTHYADSLWNDPIGNKIAMKLTMEAIRTKDFTNLPSIRTTTDYIYKSYPKQGYISTYTSTGSQKSESISVYYTEKEESQAWEIKDTVKIILGYQCQLATTEFRGRKYEAWFTMDIPINNGPWKFYGLPGLILEAYDTANDFHYTIASIRKNNLRPVTFYNFWEKEFERIERKAFLKKERKHKEDLSKTTDWDFMERDYN